MSARVLDGKQLAEVMRAEIAASVAAFELQSGVRPGLAAVLVGEDPASHIYVRNKRRACEKVGITSFYHQLPASTSQAELLKLVGRLNADPAVHGVLVQMPLPKQIDEATIVDAVSPLKDVDGFSPESLGLLAAGRPRYLACTPHGVYRLLVRNGVPLAGAHVVVVGRSNIVGKPMALILMQKGVDATVSVCHSRSRDLAGLTRQADVVVMAIGRAHFLTADMVKPGAVVIDVGMNHVPGGSPVGDVDYGPVSQVAGMITPVPGGVGPMTITMLLHNTLQAAILQTAKMPPRAGGTP
jgi:methylenetetrahydrofolate dehydrogenase (NADP+)/methenyltetrahydrofolate cyclohydrolase